MARDPVCGMTVDEGGAAGVVTWRGRRLHFCSEGCRSIFESAPDQYDRALSLPVGLERLEELASNMWCTWHRGARALFTLLDEGARSGKEVSPLRLVRTIPEDRLAAVARDPGFMACYRQVLAEFDAEMASSGNPACHASAGEPQYLVAYFSAEFGIHSSLPVYAGGLGVLAGDVAKEASDLGLPMVGVGFMYPQGYLRQRIRADGWQEEVVESLQRGLAPIRPACTESGQPCVVRLDLPGRAVSVAVWVVRAGRVPLYLMDTDVAVNAAVDRTLSARLYGGDQEMRLRQEIVVGIGGVRLLRALGIAPTVWHANEGHSAFMMVERLRELIEAGKPFDRALDEVRASTVFTTHTPVAAGHDVFPFGLIERYLGVYWPTLGLDRDRFLALGLHAGGQDRPFNMSALALRLGGSLSAVSQRHAEVSRQMWGSLLSAPSAAAWTIKAITNGVHVPTWVAEELDELYRRYLGEDWAARQDDVEVWARVQGIPAAELWNTHRELRARLITRLRDRARERWRDKRDATGTMAAGAVLDPEALTLGFARRFSTYKRAALLLHDPERLGRILTSERRPVQIIFAGKAHPADEPAKRVLQEVYRAAKAPAYEGRIAFVEDYDMTVAQLLVQGVDVWVNTPQPPLEASGTSGMKAALNGIPSLSVPDGWWLEGYDGTNGWMLGTAEDARTGAARDAADAEALYRCLEAEVIPRFYGRDGDGVPTRWTEVMKRSIETVTPRFSARRMLKQYVTELYLPAMTERRRPHGS